MKGPVLLSPEEVAEQFSIPVQVILILIEAHAPALGIQTEQGWRVKPDELFCHLRGEVVSSGPTLKAGLPTHDLSRVLHYAATALDAGDARTCGAILGWILARLPEIRRVAWGSPRKDIKLEMKLADELERIGRLVHRAEWVFYPGPLPLERTAPEQTDPEN